MSVVGRVNCPHCSHVNNVENVLCLYCNKRLDEPKADLNAKVLDPTAAVEDVLITWGDCVTANRVELSKSAYDKHRVAMEYLRDCFKLMRAQDLARARAEAEEMCVGTPVRFFIRYTDTDSTTPREVAVQLILHCPDCGARHVDEGEWAAKLHHTHSCQACGFTWRPAVVPTVGVKFLPGFKNQ